MPPAKKPAARRSSSRSSTRAASKRRTRAQVELATKRFEKALDEAGKALQALAKDAGSGAYGGVTKALRSLQRDARTTNRKLLKDLEKLAQAPRTAAGRPAARSTRSTSSTAKRSTTAKRSSSAKRATTRRTASRSTGTGRRAS